MNLFSVLLFQACTAAVLLAGFTHASEPNLSASIDAPDDAPALNADCPYVNSPDPVIDAFMELGDIGPSTVMYDLGCGDGRLVLAAAALGATAIGIERRDDLFREAQRFSQMRYLTDLASFRKEDFFTADISDATVVVMYLIPTVVEQLAPILFSKLRPGTIIISHNYAMLEYQHVAEWRMKAPNKKFANQESEAVLLKYIVPEASSTLPPALICLTAQQVQGMLPSLTAAEFVVRHTFSMRHTISYFARIFIPVNCSVVVCKLSAEDNNVNNFGLVGAADSTSPVYEVLINDHGANQKYQSSTLVNKSKYDSFFMKKSKIPTTVQVFVTRTSTETEDEL